MLHKQMLPRIRSAAAATVVSGVILVAGLSAGCHSGNTDGSAGGDQVATKQPTAEEMKAARQAELDKIEKDPKIPANVKANIEAQMSGSWKPSAQPAAPPPGAPGGPPK